MVTLTDHPNITMPWRYLATKLTVGKRPVSIDALRNLKTTSCQQDTRYKNLYYEFSAHIGAHIGMA